MVILLIPGMWLDGCAWAEVVPVLRGHGHRAVPITLPGQGDGARQATPADQVAAVVAADARPETVAGVACTGGFPSADGETYADFLPVQNEVMAFPGWEPFEGPDAADLDTATRQAMQAQMVAVPVGVTRGTVQLRDPRRLDVPVTVFCPGFSPDQAQAAVAEGDVPEPAAARHVSCADLDSGHWPMVSRPGELARVLADVVPGQ